MSIRLHVRGAVLGALVMIAGPVTFAQGAAPPGAPQAAPQAAPFDFDTGNAPLEVVVPRLVGAIYEHVSPRASDAPIVLRITTMITNGWFDAIAPYHPTAVGVYSRLGRRPAEESATNRNKNIAALYASYRVLNSVIPRHAEGWREMLTAVGLDPDDASEDLTTPAGIGNSAGNAVVAARVRDGMNQLGDEGGCAFNCQPYADYTGYRPVNTAYELRDPGRWQPNLLTRGNGIFYIQQFVTPQLRLTRPYSYDDPDEFRAPPPTSSDPANREAYRQQADEVLAFSAALTDEQKATAEFFDDKLRSIGFSAVFVTQAHQLSLDEFVYYDFLVNVAAFDAAIAVWNEKVRYDAVRPFSAIRYLYGDSLVSAWAGPGQSAGRIRGAQWRSYVNTADHPEYPSGSACFCAAHAQASRRMLGSDAMGWSVPVAQGSSRVEPGVAPASDLTLGPWETWTAFEEECGLSRLWGGMHFRASVEAGQAMCQPIGDLAYEFVQAHIDGTAD